eukprot:jgi/Tetstr1/430965/TSEL_020720.t1
MSADNAQAAAHRQHRRGNKFTRATVSRAATDRNSAPTCIAARKSSLENSQQAEVERAAIPYEHLKESQILAQSQEFEISVLKEELKLLNGSRRQATYEAAARQ